MEITDFLRKYIAMMRYNNSLPLIFLIIIDIIVHVYVFKAVLTEPDNIDKTLPACIDFINSLLLIYNAVRRSLNHRESIKLIELIEDEFAVCHSQFDSSNADLWTRIEKFFKEKRENMTVVARNSAMFFIVMLFFVINRNILNQLIGLESHSNEYTSLPTPYLSYCLPDFKSPVFFVYAYSLHILLVMALNCEGFVAHCSVYLAIERVLADFETLYMLLDDIVHEYDEDESSTEQFSFAQQQSKMTKLRNDMARVVRCHQTINRNFRIVTECSEWVVTSINTTVILYCIVMAYFFLTSDDLKKRLNFGSFFIVINLAAFFFFHNGQRIFNQNDILRQTLANIPWTDKPKWFNQTLLTMLIRANVNTEMKPYGIYTLNYLSFKDFMKITFSTGNVIYTRKLATQT
ncbi:uncharacterized protein LOC111050107 [Nilaparvata lugens]|uniref:uncharacterized protein LOC111050107 n=1 Tax=Nilaparvata lugens TaxID=108931 RepID=UPI00193D07D4|nr:uncharacterized protein LOC111050107 [Nilaparvata lugens]